MSQASFWFRNFRAYVRNICAGNSARGVLILTTAFVTILASVSGSPDFAFLKILDLAQENPKNGRSTTGDARHRELARSIDQLTGFSTARKRREDNAWDSRRVFQL
jgi:hypothetical protein